MKTLIYTATFLLPLFSFAQTQQKTTIAVNANYHNRSCVGGTGFCSDSDAVTESKTNNAIVEKTAHNQLTLTFDLKELSNREAELLTLEKVFSVDGTSNLSIDRTLLSKLNIDIQFSEIPVGFYPVVIENSKAHITFTLSKK